MMYQRTDLTLSMFYASSADADGNKVATLTMQVIAAEAGAVQTSQLRCITDSAKKKTYIKARGNDASIDYSCSIQNITATAFRTNSNSFS
ncbi:hypothetical protein [Klebsiella variicola]|uniref:hypothetical protein n=1 Tax=Klebsiella variicola TaxID=244366 RepID=UPI00103482C4|nr:hypothetical protein [Klebsiella variicola]